MKRIYYLTKIDFSSERTNVHNTARTVEAVNLAGLSMTLVSTETAGDLAAFFARHHVERPFPVIGLSGARSASAKLSLIRANAMLMGFLFRMRNEYDAVYTRDEQLVFAALFARLIGKPVFFEIHSVLVGWHRQALNRVMLFLSRGVVAISVQLKEYYARSHRKIAVSYCGGDESFWTDYAATKAELRQSLGLPENKFLVGYAGVMGKNANEDIYEMDVPLLALKAIPDAVFVAVGERGNDAEWLRTVARKHGLADRLIVLPWQERSAVPNYLRAFDAIVVPRRTKDLASDSPLKMFTALSTGRPIIAGRSRAITEVLEDGKNACIVKENDVPSYAEKIRAVMTDGALAQKISDTALRDSQKYTWEKRGAGIAQFVNGLSENRR